MTNKCWVVLLLCFLPAIASLAASAQEPPTPQQLIDAAHKVLDLTSLGPYTLTANVVVDSGDEKTRKTGRLMIVRDRDRTREELEFGGAREIRLFLGGKQYIVSLGLLSGLGLMDFDRRWDPVHFIASRFNSVRRDKVEGADAWCMNWESGQLPSSCFDAVKGVYLGAIPNERMSDEYFDFTSVGNQIFYPRRAVMLRNDFGRIEVNSIEITPGAAKDDLFALPDNAIEIERCRRQTPVKPLYQPEANYPERERKQKQQGKALFSIIVDKEGNVAAAQLLTAPTEGLAREAEAAVRKWRFQPATCDGRSVNQELNWGFHFHLY
jgi:TonB family protein